MVLFYNLQNDVTVMLPNEFAKMIEICEIKLGIILHSETYVLTWIYLLFMCLYNFLINY